jgi:ribA/ribD-fused uncharacterized protein
MTGALTERFASNLNVIRGNSMAILFYSTRGKYGGFSNFSKHGVLLDGLWWKTTEHYFQAQKFEDAEYREKIRLAPDPKTAANLGRSRKVKLRDDWEAVKDDVMRKAVSKKFEAHDELRDLLLSTDNEEIIEDAPGDYYWGWGKEKSGKNMLGKILMEVRESLRK